MADPMLKTKEQNQNVFVALFNVDGSSPKDICRVVAVTLDKNVAIVVKCKYSPMVRS